MIYLDDILDELIKALAPPTLIVTQGEIHGKDETRKDSDCGNDVEMHVV